LKKADRNELLLAPAVVQARRGKEGKKLRNKEHIETFYAKKDRTFPEMKTFCILSTRTLHDK
jgi:hypothetical protein